VEDGSQALTAYLDFVLNNIGAEQDDNVLRHVMGSLGSTFSYFGRFGGHEAERARIEEYLLAQLQAANAGSELQKIWYDGFVARAHTPAALDYLAALLVGTETLPGLTIDQDKRWGIVTALNRYQHGNYIGLLETERSNDASDQGYNMALAADAIRPEADIKARWLDALLNQRAEYKLASLRTVMASLFPDEQLALLAPHVDDILGAIPALDSSSDIEFLSDFTDYMSAALCTPESAARLAQANEEFVGFQPAIVKAYLVHQQQDARCVRLKALLQ
jgi:aminopeptidase N